MHFAHGIHRQPLRSREPRHGHGSHVHRSDTFHHTEAQPERAQRLAMRYDILKERLTALHSEPRKNMQAIDGVIALLARTQLHLKALQAARL